MEEKYKIDPDKIINNTYKKRKCYNCKYASQQFKVGKLTHLHCQSPTYEKQHKDGEGISPWETLRVFSDTCEEHEFKTPKI